ELRRMQQMLRHGRDDARAPLLRAGEPAHAVGDEEEKAARLGLLRSDPSIEARRMDVERPVEARDEKVIGVRAADEARVREAEDVHLGERRALERGVVLSRGLHGALLRRISVERSTRSDSWQQIASA